MGSAPVNTNVLCINRSLQPASTRMGNRKRSRELQKETDDLTAFARAGIEPRHFQTDVHWRGCGVRRIQIIELPSFEDGELWDIRQLGERWSLYFSTIRYETSLAHGYAKIGADSNTLRGYFERACCISLPLKPDLSGMGDVDGTLWQITLTGDLSTEIKVQWWNGLRKEWRELTDLVTGILDEIRRLPVVEDEFPVPRRNTEQSRPPENAS